MNTSATIVTLIMVIGGGYILYYILRDPVLMLKSVLRMFNPDNLKWNMKIALFPIWGTIWLIDRYSGFKIFIKNFEDESIPVKINFEDFDKYIQVYTDDLPYIQGVVDSFQRSRHYNNNNTSNKTIFKYAYHNKHILIKIENDINFYRFNTLIKFIDNSAPTNHIYHVKGILINKLKKTDSYFCFVDLSYSLQLIGKTYQNKKMYVELVNSKSNSDEIYLNSNIEYFKNFNFYKFELDLKELNYSDINF